ncbi:hypothetical protein [Nisaea sp.]|uniref:hypothetical protein n=1 Tax=Nisaea sp. TaxID=2024842 RepID=UPI002B268470|nr:hypothetical protein [Nisaea sp.]
MDAAPSFLLTLHIATGAVSLATAAVAIAAPKGRRLHRLAGKLYVLSMVVVFATAVSLSLATNDLFLMTVAIFSFYMVLSGYRALYLKQPARSFDSRYRVGALDKGAAQFTMIACSAMATYGGVYWYTEPLAPVLVVLGSVGSLMAFFDLKRFRSPPKDPRAWFFTHMTRMLGGTIASVTAFLVNTGDMLPPLARWLAPTIIGTAAIILWVAYYKRKFSGGAEPETVAEVRLREMPEEDEDDGI